LVSVSFLKKNSDSVGNEFVLVRFGKKTWFGSDIVVVYNTIQYSLRLLKELTKRSASTEMRALKQDTWL